LPLIDTLALPVNNKRPGWRGRVFHAESMTFAHWDFDAGATIHEHGHEQEEVWHLLEGELEITIDGKAEVARAGMVAIVPPNTPHAVKALVSGRAIVADHPSRPDF
jgi:quercetin dioxygenase-like cupin family protein